MMTLAEGKHMNSQVFARKALVLIYQTTTIEKPMFTIDRIVRGTQEAIPDTFKPEDLASCEAFVTTLEVEAHVLPVHELQGLARLALTRKAFATAMQHHYASGELPVMWARWFKDVKGDYRTLDLLHQAMKNLGAEAK